MMELDPTNPPKRKRGRPKKNGAKDLKDLGRALKIVHAYAEAREKRLKHSAAVREAVEFIRRLDPGTRISETGVKRVLAEFMPQNSQTALKVDFSVLEGDEAARTRSRLVQLQQSVNDESAIGLTGQCLRKPFKAFKFGFEKRPNYERHNAKSPKP